MGLRSGRRGEKDPKSAAEIDPVVSWMQRTEDRLTEVSRAATERQDRVASALSDALAAVAERLNTIERRVASRDQDIIPSEQRPPLPGERPAFGRSPAHGPTHGPMHGPTQTQVALLGSLKSDIAKLASRLETHPKSDVWAPTVASIRNEIDRLQAVIGSLATRHEIADLECLIRTMSEEVVHAAGSVNAASLKVALDQLQGQIRHLSEDMMTGVHGRLASEMGEVVRRIEMVAASGADAKVVAHLSTEMAEMRAILANIAEPQRIERLVQEVASLSQQVAAIHRQQVGVGDLTALKDAMEDIRSALKSPERDRQASEVPHQLRSLGSRIDALLNRPEPVSLDPIAEQLNLIADQLAHVTAHRQVDADTVASQFRRLSDRLDELDRHSGPDRIEDNLARLEESIRQVKDSSDTTAIELMMRAMSGKLEDVKSARADFERLEKHIHDLSAKLDRDWRHDPEFSELRNAIDDLIAQTKTLREEATLIAERAAQTALERARDAGPLKEFPSASSDLDLVKQGLADLQALQLASDKKAQQALKAVHGALETLVARTAAGVPQGTARPPGASFDRAYGPPRERLQPPQVATGRADSSAARLEAAVRKLHAAAFEGRDQDEPTAGRPQGRAAPQGDIALDLGASRANGFVRPTGLTAPGDADAVSVRDNYIAAARRASHPARDGGLDMDDEDGRERDDQSEAEEPALTLLQRLKQAIGAHRGPIIVGAATVIIFAGTIRMMLSPEEHPPARIAAAPARIEQALPSVRAIKDEPVQTGSTQKSPEALAHSQVAVPVPAPRQEMTPEQPASETKQPASESRAVAPSAENRPVAPSVENRPVEPSAEGRVSKPAAQPAPSSSPAPQAVTALPSEETATAPGAPKTIPDIASVGEMPAGIPEDLRQAAIAGDPAAVFEVATRATEGRGMARDVTFAAKLYKKAAIAGLAPAQFRLGNFYEKGVGLTRDVASARTWYERAAEAGNTRAMHNLAVLLADGASGKPDYTAALQWFEQAAEFGVRDSQYNLGVLYARGLGTQQDLAQSYKWFAIAALQGDEDAAKKRDEVAARLKPADFETVKSAVAAWQARPADRTANEVAPPAPAKSVGVAPRPQKGQG